MKGRRKTPTAVKELSGTNQPCRENPNEPKPDLVKSVDCPEWFSDNPVALETWNWATGVLNNMKILSEADLPTVEMFCLTYAELRQLYLELAVEGRVLFDIKMDSLGNEIKVAKANPRAIQFNNLLTQYRMFSGMLGFDPSSRPRLQADDLGEDPLDEFFS